MFGAAKKPVLQQKNALGEASFELLIPYRLNWKFLDKQPIRIRKIGTDDNAGANKKFSEVVSWLSELRVKHTFTLTRLSIDTESGEEIEIEAEGNVLRILETHIKMVQAGEHLYDAVWYFYDSDHACDGPNFAYSFFIASGKKIVVEFTSLFFGSNDEYDPELFEQENHDEGWAGAMERERAFSIWLYQKFFRDTDTGQIQAIADKLRSE